MVTQISLGSFGQVNGKNVVTGGSSGIDTKTLIDGLVSAKRLPAVRLETADKLIDTQTKAYSDLKTLYTKLQTSADTLRNAPGVDTSSNNIFSYRKASLTGTGGVTASDYVDATVLAGAAAQTYTINSITQLATATKQLSGNISIADSSTASAVTASSTAGLFKAGTVNLRAVDGTVGGIPITLNAGDSLQAVAAKFNEVSSRTGMQASILNVSTGVYKMVFTATKTGTTYGFDLGLTSPAAGAGVASDASGVLSQMSFTTNLPAAQNAIFSVDGVSITRESNAVSDVIDGVTLTLKNSNMGGGSVLMNIQPDTSMAVTAITSFADAYNAFRLFVSKQNELDDNGQPKSTAVLYNSSTFRSMVNDVSNEVARVVAGITNSGDPTQLSDVGLTLTNFAGDDTNLATKNILTVDTDKLTASLTSNFDGVRKLFEYNQTSDNTNFVNYKRSNKLDDVASFVVTINATTNTYTATYTTASGATGTATFDATALSTGGVDLKGQVGSVFEGSEFIFAAAGNATVNVKVSQGYGDRFYNLMDSYINTTDGTLTQEVTTLADTKTRNTDEVTAIDAKMATYRDQLTQQYANLESAISKANQLLQLLDAQSKAASSNG